MQIATKGKSPRYLGGIAPVVAFLLIIFVSRCFTVTIVALEEDSLLMTSSSASADGRSTSTTSSSGNDLEERLRTIAKKNTRRFTPVPRNRKKTFFMKNVVQSNVYIQQAFEDRLGFRKVPRMNKARFVFWKYYRDHPDWPYEELQPWQRMNFIPNFKLYDDKDTLWAGMREYANKARGLPFLDYMPRTFRLADSGERRELLDYLGTKTGWNRPWVVKEPAVNGGKGVTIHDFRNTNGAEPSPSEVFLFEEGAAKKHKQDNSIIQEYICDPFLPFGGRKIDLRAYWLTASIDPLYVLYHDGFFRIAGGTSNSTEAVDKKNGVTNISSGGSALPWDKFSVALSEYFDSNPQKAQELRERGIFDPMQHIRDQMKAIVVETIEAFREKAFVKGNLKADNGFTLYASDFAINSDFDLFLMETQFPDLGSYFGSETGGFNTTKEVIDEALPILMEVQDKQEVGLPVYPLDTMGDWECVYFTEEYKFRYQMPHPRANNKC